MFNAPADGYDRLIGRYLPTLAPVFADLVPVAAGMAVLDVGCGPGGLTTELVSRVGAESVAAIDPSAPFVAACRSRHPGVDVREGFAESLPWTDGSFDAVLASLVVGFMNDPVSGVSEMARVAKPGATVAACQWDRGGMKALQIAGQAMVVHDSSLHEDLRKTGDTEGELAEVFRKAGLIEVEDGVLIAHAEYANFDDWWEPFTLGIGPHGAHLKTLDDELREAIRLTCLGKFEEPDKPFTLEARAWFARGTVRAPGA